MCTLNVMFALHISFKHILILQIGHCLGIAESGILNFDRCHFFAQGCPDEVYYSNEMYKCMYS